MVIRQTKTLLDIWEYRTNFKLKKVCQVCTVCTACLLFTLGCISCKWNECNAALNFFFQLSKLFVKVIKTARYVKQYNHLRQSTFFFNVGSKHLNFILISLFAFLQLKARKHSNKTVMKTFSLGSIRSAKGKGPFTNYVYKRRGVGGQDN